MITSGQFIKSTSLLKGSYFENTIIFIVEKNKEGAIGFVMNRPFGRSIHELAEFHYSKPFRLFEGGPVDQEHLFVLHNRPDLVSGGTPLPDGSYYGGSIDDVLEAINNKHISENEVRLFVGYCGWDFGELETEIEEGSWSILTNVPTF